MKFKSHEEFLMHIDKVEASLEAKREKDFIARRKDKIKDFFGLTFIYSMLFLPFYPLVHFSLKYW